MALHREVDRRLHHFLRSQSQKDKQGKPPPREDATSRSDGYQMSRVEQLYELVEVEEFETPKGPRYRLALDGGVIDDATGFGKKYLSKAANRFHFEG